MKTLFIITMLSSFAVACPSGCEKYQGMCACNEPAIKAEPVDATSDERPSKHPQAAWERGEVKAAMPESLIASDRKLDDEKAQADKEGKKAAGIPY